MIEAMKDLIECVEAAIKAGDWKIDGACDPTMALERACQAIATEEDGYQGSDAAKAAHMMDLYTALGVKWGEDPFAVIAKMREAATEESSATQEPVAWRGYNWSHTPDDWVYRDFDDPILDGKGNNVGQPLYTHPQQKAEQEPKREWADLTEDEVTEIIEKFYPRSYGMDAVVIAAQTKLRNKNT